MNATLYLRDASLVRSGQRSFDTLEARVLFNAPGNIRVSGRWADLHPATEPGAGLIVDVDGQWIAGGPVYHHDRTRSADGDTVTIYAATDDVWLWRRLALPDPAGPPYTAESHDVRAGTFDVVAGAYVDANLGPGATVDRRLDGVVVEAPDAPVGAEVTGRARFDVLGSLLTSLAIAAGDVRFELVQPTGLEQLAFRCHTPADRTADIRLAEDLGSLAGFVDNQDAPTATYAYVAGGGELTARAFEEGGVDSPWGRIETFVDQRQTSVPAELLQARDAALDAGAGARSVTVTTKPVRAFSWPGGYGLGDLVAVDVDGEQLAAVVREVVVTAGRDGPVRMTPLVDVTAGPPRSRLPSTDRIRQLERRLSAVETAL